MVLASRRAKIGWHNGCFKADCQLHRGAGQPLQGASPCPSIVFSRRSFLQSAAAGTAAAALGFPQLANAQSGVTIGIVYVGPKDDFGWNQAHAVSIGVLKATPGVKIIEEENVPETAAVAKSMESMINLEGAN